MAVVCYDNRNNRGLCEDTQETCSRRVLSKDGCCPICGTYIATELEQRVAILESARDIKFYRNFFIIVFLACM